MQTPDERSHSTSYMVVSEGEKIDTSGKKAGRKISSKVVLVLSNYHFNRDKQSPKFKPCTPADCTVGLKYSSSEFVIVGTPERDAGFHFDRFGVLIPFDAFVSLLTNQSFKNYIEKCKARYDKQVNDASSTVEAVVVDDDDEDEDGEETVVVKKGGKKKRTGDSVEQGSGGGGKKKPSN